MKGPALATSPWMVLKSGNFIQLGLANVTFFIKVLSSPSPYHAVGLLFPPPRQYLSICQASNLCSYPASFRWGNHRPGLLWLKWSLGTKWQQRLGTGWCKAPGDILFTSAAHAVLTCFFCFLKCCVKAHEPLTIHWLLILRISFIVCLHASLPAPSHRPASNLQRGITLLCLARRSSLAVFSVAVCCFSASHSLFSPYIPGRFVI